MAKIQITISAQNAQAIAALQQVAGAAKQSGDTINSSARSGAQGLNQASKSAGQLGQTLADVTIIAGGITYALNKIKEAATVLVKPGIDFYRTMESSRLGVAGILMSMTKLNGQELKLNDALSIADSTFKSLQKTSLEFSLNVEDTAAGFQSIVGPGLAAKMTMDEIANIAVRGTKAVKSFGLDSMQVVQELRSMVTGDINMDSQVSKALGITAAGVAQAKTQVGGLYAYLTEKLSGFLAVGEEIPKTLNGKLERTNTLMKMISAEGFSPFIQLLKSGFDAVNGYLTVTVEETNDLGEKIKVVKLNPELIKGLQDASKYISSLIRDGTSFAFMLADIASGPASLLLSVIKLILDHAAQVTFTLMAWLGIQKAISVFRAIQMQIIAVRGAAIAAGSAITGMEAATILLGRAIKSVLISTGWGILAVAIGAVADKMYSLYENTEKARKAKKGLLGEEDKGLGSLSAKYESNGDAGVIANTSGDAGGKSYGAWQLSYNMGSLQRFVKWLNDGGWEAGKLLTRGGNKYAGIPEHDVVIGSAEFDTLWKEAADKYGESFLNAQKQYIKEAFYDVGVEQAKSVYVDLEKRSEALKNVIWSAAVQHGPENIADLLQQAAALLNQPNASYLTDEQLINAIYAVRSTDEWTSGSPGLRPQLRERFNDEMNEALMRLQKESPVSVSGGKGNLTLKNPADDAEALAKAKIALAEAISSQKLQEYISNLQSQQNQLDQRKQATEGNFTSESLPTIGASEYRRQTALITRQIAEAQIAKLEEERQHLEQLAANNNLSSVESPINLQAQIVQKNTEIATARSKLAESLQQLGFEDSKAQKELMDLVANLEIQLLEERGRTAEAAKLKNDREKQPLVTKLQAENKTGAVDTVNKLYDIRQAKADFEQTQQDLELANSELVTTQANLMNELAAGTKSASKVTDEYVRQYNAKMQAVLADLKRQLDAAGDNRELAEKIRAAIREISDKLSEFFDAVIARIDAELQNEIAMINADRGMTKMQKQDAIDAVTRQKAGERADEYERQAKKARSRGDIETAIQAEDAAALNRKLAEIPSLLDKIHESSKQAFEDGLLTFLTDGITQCSSLGEAFRNLANTVLSAIQRVYAEALTKNIMSLMGLGTSKKTPEFTLPAQNVVATKALAQGGSTMESGLVKGPGTSTSDSILAWVQNAKKWLFVGNGEWVMRGKAVQKYGTRAMDAINSGRVPVSMLQRFAVGGSLTNKGFAGSSLSLPGPQDIATTLSSGDTNIHLKTVNVTDPNEVGRYLQSRNGEKVMVNWMKNNAGTVRQILAIKG